MPSPKDPECVSKVIRELKENRKDMDRKQRVAVALRHCKLSTKDR